MSQPRKTIIPEPDFDQPDSAVRDATERTKRAMAKVLETERGRGAAERLGAEIDGIVTRQVPGLAAIRRARCLTQQQMSVGLGISQGDVSRLEARANLMLTTLARFIEASGGRLRILAEFEDERLELDVEELTGASTDLG